MFYNKTKTNENEMPVCHTGYRSGKQWEVRASNIIFWIKKDTINVVQTVIVSFLFKKLYIWCSDLSLYFKTHLNSHTCIIYI